MKKRFFTGVILAAAVIFLAGQAPAASTGADLQKAKKAAEAKGYLFEPHHDTIVERAKKEGQLHVLTSLDPDTQKPMLTAFMKKYPFINATLEEITGTDGLQRFLLELKAGTVRNKDVSHASPDFYNEYAPFTHKYDLLGMAEGRVLNFHAGMVDPQYRTIVSMSSPIGCIAYNKKLLPPGRVPNTWDDFLKPEFKGRKFITDIRPNGMASLIPGMTEEWVLNYARKLREQDPVWIRGNTRALTGIATGEYSLHQMTQYHSCVRAKEADRTQSLECKIIEPVPVRLSEHQFILNNAAHPYAALLWLEFVASAEGQKIIDEFEPVKSHIYGGGVVAQLLKGKKISFNSADTFHETPEWMKRIIEAYGFPEAGGKTKKKEK